VHQAVRAELAEATAHFRQWVADAPARALHRYANKPNTNPHPAKEFDAPGVDPDQAMEHRLSFWKSKWQRDQGQQQELERQLTELRAAAFKAPHLPPLTATVVREALATYPPNVGQGLDAWNPFCLETIARCSVECSGTLFHALRSYGYMALATHPCQGHAHSQAARRGNTDLPYTFLGKALGENAQSHADAVVRR